MNRTLSLFVLPALLLAGCSGKTPADDTEVAAGTDSAATDAPTGSDSATDSDGPTGDDSASDGGAATDDTAMASADDTENTGADTSDTDGGISIGDDTATTISDEDLYGSYPAAPVSVPEFVATNYDGTSRSRADLEGHYTIMWFYPLAGTAG